VTPAHSAGPPEHARGPRLASFGESALLATFGDRIEPVLAERARALADAWESAGMGPAVPAYASTVLHFDPLEHSLLAVRRLARDFAMRALEPLARRMKTVEIPVRYDGDDLEEVARLSHLEVSEVVALHTAREYTAYFLGFLPGFAYLGELDPKIAAPRLSSPRERVPAGSVGIAGSQTGVYPRVSPGGWRLIGRTDVVLFDASRDPPSLIAAGDRVRFVAVP
jgi:inhibitor of KinA